LALTSLGQYSSFTDQGNGKKRQHEWEWLHLFQLKNVVGVGASEFDEGILSESFGFIVLGGGLTELCPVAV
jgi:hypothetical protein